MPPGATCRAPEYSSRKQCSQNKFQFGLSGPGLPGLSRFEGQVHLGLSQGSTATPLAKPLPSRVQHGGSGLQREAAACRAPPLRGWSPEEHRATPTDLSSRKPHVHLPQPPRRPEPPPRGSQGSDEISGFWHLDRDLGPLAPRGLLGQGPDRPRGADPAPPAFIHWSLGFSHRHLAFGEHRKKGGPW